VNFPEIFIPFVFLGKVSQLAWSNRTTMPANSSVTSLTRPSVPGMVRMRCGGFMSPARDTVTGDIVLTTKAGLTWDIKQVPKVGGMPVFIQHTRYFLESMREKNFFSPYFWFLPQLLIKFNDESFSLTYDVAMWDMETPEAVYFGEMIPYMQGIVNYYTKLGAVQV